MRWKTLSGLVAAMSLVGCLPAGGGGGSKSSVGEDCEESRDCKSGLICINQVCERDQIDPDAGIGGEGGGAGGEGGGAGGEGGGQGGAGGGIGGAGGGAGGEGGGAGGEGGGAGGEGGGAGGEGGGAGGAGGGGGDNPPEVISFSAQREVSNGEALVFVARATDPDGVGDVVYGRLETADGEHIRDLEGGNGDFTAEVRWFELNMVTPINFIEPLEVEFQVRFYDRNDNQVTARTSVTFSCSEGEAACGGSCGTNFSCFCDGGQESLCVGDQAVFCGDNAGVLNCGDLLQDGTVQGICVNLEAGATCAMPEGTTCAFVSGEQDVFFPCHRDGEIVSNMGCVQGVCAPAPRCNEGTFYDCTPDNLVVQGCLENGGVRQGVIHSCADVTGVEDSTCDRATDACTMPDSGGICFDEVIECTDGRVCEGQNPDAGTPGQCMDP